MRYRNWQLVNILIFLLLTFVNILIYLHRDEGFAFKELLSYDQLYQLPEDLRILDFENKKGDSLVVKLSKNFKSHWKVIDKNGTYESYGTPVLKLHEGKQTYSIQNENDAGIAFIQIGLNYVPSAVYIKSGRNRESVTELFSCNIPLGELKTHPLNEWQQKSAFSTDTEQKELELILKAQLRAAPGDSTITTIKKTAAFLLKRLDECRGISSGAMDLFSPMKRFNAAVTGHSKVWCGDFADILSYFLCGQGIVCRTVTLEGKLGDVYKAGHVFNEVYVPELRKWLFMDLTSNTILAMNTKGEYLNTLEFYNLHLRSPESIVISTVEHDSIKNIGYKGIKTFYDYYFGSNSHFVYYLASQFEKDTYSFATKLKRYFTASPTFALYAGSNEGSNEKFYQKQCAALTLIVFTLYWTISGALMRRKKNSQSGLLNKSGEETRI